MTDWLLSNLWIIPVLPLLGVLTPAEVELLSILEHRRWVERKVERGFKMAKAGESGRRQPWAFCIGSS